MLTPRRGKAVYYAAIGLPIALGVLVVAVFIRGAMTPHRHPHPPSGPRIVVLSPAIAVILRDLGLEGLVVGRHAYDLILDKSIPSCGDESGLDYEAIIRTRTTHVLMESGAAGPPQRLRDLAQQHTWQLHSYPMLSLADIRACVGAVAHLLGRSPEALLARMDAAWAPREGIYTGRVLLLASADPPAALGPGSFHYQLLQRLGGRPAITTGNPYITMDAEDVLHLGPDAIILILPRAPTPSLTATDRLKHLGRLGTLDIPAVRDAHVALIEHPLAHTPSTAMIDVADRLADVLESWK